eukprot:1586777-Pleurochrysis_carterae.AAC.4
MARLRVRESAEILLMAKAQPVPRPQMGFSLRERNVSSAEGPRERSGYSLRERRKCVRECSRCVPSSREDKEGATDSFTGCKGAAAGVDAEKGCCGGGGA